MTLPLNKFVPFAVLLMTVSSIQLWTSLPIQSTLVWWILYISILISFFIAKNNYYDVSNNKNIHVILVYLTWNFICILRGTAVADNYYEWKNLVIVGMVSLLPLSIYLATNTMLIQAIFSTWVKYALPAFFIFLPFFKEAQGYGCYLVPVGCLLLFFPILPLKWKWILILFTAFIIFGGITARSNVIKFSAALLLSLIFYFKHFISNRFLKLVSFIFLVSPIILFLLALSGKFNIFKMDEYIDDEIKTTVITNGVVQEENLTIDTRTFLYEEVLSSARKYDYIWLGRTPARGNESAWFGNYAIETLKTGKMERFANEASILNVFTWTGIVGVVLYFLVFFRASYIAINRSNNIFSKILGLYVSFRWAFSWVEDSSEFDLTNFFLWAMIGMCFSNAFREMSNSEIKYWIYGIFDDRYRNVYVIDSY